MAALLIFGDKRASSAWILKLPDGSALKRAKEGCTAKTAKESAPTPKDLRNNISEIGAFF